MTEQRRQVLVVEDEAPIRELVRFHLALAGFDASSSEMAVQAAEIVVIVVHVHIRTVRGSC